MPSRCRRTAAVKNENACHPTPRLHSADLELRPRNQVSSKAPHSGVLSASAIDDETAAEP